MRVCAPTVYVIASPNAGLFPQKPFAETLCPMLQSSARRVFFHENKDQPFMVLNAMHVHDLKALPTNK